VKLRFNIATKLGN